MKNKKIIERSRNLGYVIACEQFVSFVNPKNRGSKFTWKNFPKIVKEYAEASAYMGFSNEEWDRHEELIVKTVSETAHLNALKFVERSGVK